MMFKVGDKIRVLVDKADYADVGKGDEFIVEHLRLSYGTKYVGVDSPGPWWISFENIELVTDNK